MLYLKLSCTNIEARPYNVFWAKVGPNFDYATLISPDENPENFSALDPDNDELYVLTHKAELRATPTIFVPKQVQSAIRPFIFSAQEAGNCSNVYYQISGIVCYWPHTLIPQWSFSGNVSQLTHF